MLSPLTSLLGGQPSLSLKEKATPMPHIGYSYLSRKENKSLKAGEGSFLGWGGLSPEDVEVGLAGWGSPQPRARAALGIKRPALSTYCLYEPGYMIAHQESAFCICETDALQTTLRACFISHRGPAWCLSQGLQGQ